MTALQAAALGAVAICGTLVVVTRPPLKQALVAGIYGLALAILFFAFQAPDVALSQIVVSSVGLPLMIVVALRKIREQAEEQQEQEEEKAE